MKDLDFPAFGQVEKLGAALFMWNSLQSLRNPW